MADAHLSLSWDAYQKNICSGLSLLQQRGEFVDMTLAADGHHVKVHQMVLSLVSPYIKELISSAQSPHPIIFLNNISYTTLSSLLEYVYTGEVHVPKEGLSDLIAAGKALQIKGLKEMNDANVEPSVHQRDPILELSTNKTLQEVLEQKKNRQNNVKIKEEPKLLQPMCKIFVNENSDEDMEIVENSDTCSINEKKTYNIMNSTIQRGIKDKGSTSNISNVQYSLSNQGNLQVIVNRYIYSFKYVQKKLIRFWQCADCATKKCPANISTNDKNQVVKRMHNHTHPFHDEKILKKVRLGLIFSAYNEAESQAQSKRTNRKKSVTGLPSQESDSK